MHSNNLIHRDIKSDNILFRTKGTDECKLADFGLACLIDPKKGGIKQFSGTLFYMAPEIIQQNGNGIYPDLEDDAQIPLMSFPIDVWAIGVMAYELITGLAAFEFAAANECRLYNAILYK